MNTLFFKKNKKNQSIIMAFEIASNKSIESNLKRGLN